MQLFQGQFQGFFFAHPFLERFSAFLRAISTRSFFWPLRGVRTATFSFFFGEPFGQALIFYGQRQEDFLGNVGVSGIILPEESGERLFLGQVEAGEVERFVAHQQAAAVEEDLEFPGISLAEKGEDVLVGRPGRPPFVFPESARRPGSGRECGPPPRNAIPPRPPSSFRPGA